MGIFYLSNCNSNPGFPFHKACVVAPQLCSILRQSRSNTQASVALSYGVFR